MIPMFMMLVIVFAMVVIRRFSPYRSEDPVRINRCGLLEKQDEKKI